jgi:hypothetical protein
MAEESGEVVRLNCCCGGLEFLLLFLLLPVYRFVKNRIKKHREKCKCECHEHD